MSNSTARLALLAVVTLLNLLWQPACGDERASERVPDIRPIASLKGWLRLIRAQRIEVSPRITRITKPLTKSGRVDYTAALNEWHKGGAASDDNAAVLFAQAMGPKAVPESHRKRYFKLLRIPVPPDKGDYFVPLEDWARENVHDVKKLVDQEEVAMRRPWSAEEFPALALWLRANKKPLKLIIQGSWRDRFYSPMVLQTELLEYPVSQFDSPALYAYDRLDGPELREAARALAIGAMLEAQAARIENAEALLLAKLRLGRLLRERPTAMDDLDGNNIESNASTAIAKLALRNKWPPATIRRLQAELRRLEDLPPLRRTYDLGERCLALELLTRISEQGLETAFVPPGAWERMSSEERLNYLPRWLVFQLESRVIDWNEVMRHANARFDVYAAATEMDREERDAALDRLSATDMNLMDDMDSYESRLNGSLLLFLVSYPNAATESYGRFLASRAATEAVSAHMHGRDRAITHFRMARIALALSAYHQDHERYPPGLEALAPHYMEKVPSEVFVDGEFRYLTTDAGFRLYSVGRDGVDNGGREEDKEGQYVDDIAFETSQSG